MRVQLQLVFDVDVDAYMALPDPSGFELAGEGDVPDDVAERVIELVSLSRAAHTWQLTGCTVLRGFQ